MTIDPGVFRILPESFIRVELAKFPRIRGVGLASFLYDRKKIWGCYLDSDEEILLDPSVPRELICQWANAKHEDFGLKCSEAWIYVFAHEVKHSESRENEWEANEYARRVILERRAEVERFYINIRNIVAETVKESVKLAFQCSK